jgi:hypothetical protein
LEGAVTEQTNLREGIARIRAKKAEAEARSYHETIERLDQLVGVLTLDLAKARDLLAEAKTALEPFARAHISDDALWMPDSHWRTETFRRAKAAFANLKLALESNNG